MKLVVALLAFFLMGACASAPSASNGQAGAMRVMTFNVRYDNPQDGADAWPNRRGHVASLIAFHDPDVIGLQEVLLHQRDQLAADLGQYAFVGVGRDDGKDGGEFAPLGYRRDRLEMIEHGHFWLSPTPDAPSVGWDAALPRITTWARLEPVGGGREILAVNTHFDHRGMEARRMSAIQVRDWVKENRKACEMVVVVGDFNAPPSEAAYREIIAGGMLTDARLASETPPFGPAGTFSGFDVRETRDAPIDHVFVNAGARVIRHGVITQHDAGRLPSDHYPVLADIAGGACPAATD